MWRSRVRKHLVVLAVLLCGATPQTVTRYVKLGFLEDREWPFTYAPAVVMAIRSYQEDSELQGVVYNFR